MADQGLTASTEPLNEEGDATLDSNQPVLKTEFQPKIDINSLKNEILTDGMQVSVYFELYIARRYSYRTYHVY